MNPASELRHDIADWVLAMPAAAALGFTFASLGDGRCETRLDWRPRHSHVSGAFQAGPIGCLADFTGASAAVSLLPPGTAAATVDLTVKLLAEARGEALIATGRAFSPARTLTVAAVDIDVVTTQGRSLCATALVTIRVRRPPLAASSSLPTQT